MRQFALTRTEITRSKATIKLNMKTEMYRAGIFVFSVLLGFLASCEGVKHSRKLLGCYVDTIPRIFPNYYRDTGGSIDGCYNKAIQLGYDMFAVQNGGECWLDDSRKNDYNKFGTSEKCVNGKGGRWVNSVYRVDTFCTRQTQEGICCVFPFIYDSKQHFSCITTSHSREWCSTTANYDNDGDWGNCVDPCEPGWNYFDSKCYKAFGNGRSTWDIARKNCRSYGADLVKITNLGQNQFVAKLVPDDIGTWIGLRRATDRKFYWVDATRTRFTKWHRNEPNNRDGNENCGEISHYTASWNDAPCSYNRAFICEKGY